MEFHADLIIVAVVSSCFVIMVHGCIVSGKTKMNLSNIIKLVVLRFEWIMPTVLMITMAVFPKILNIEYKFVLFYIYFWHLKQLNSSLIR